MISPYMPHDDTLLLYFVIFDFIRHAYLIFRFAYCARYRLYIFSPVTIHTPSSPSASFHLPSIHAYQLSFAMPLTLPAMHGDAFTLLPPA